MAESHYDTLGVSPAAPPEVVRAAYQALAKLYHPDGETPDEDRMKGINVAWGVLRDPVTRSAYDAELDDGSSAATSTVGSDDETSEPVLGDEGWGEGVEGSCSW